MSRILAAFLLIPLTACGSLSGPGVATPATPAAVVDARPPPPSARTVEEFDTTTEAQRIAAAEPAFGGRLLGTAVASLGDPSLPGFWIETPLVQVSGRGRLVSTANGKSVEVELRPVAGGSSRVSLAALRLLDASLTDLVALEVYGLN